MLLKGDVMTIVQKWGPTPRHAGSKMGLASDEQFSTRVVHAAFDSKQVQTWLLHHGKGGCLSKREQVSDTCKADYYPIDH
jgi:hypothetical protein